ncbi:MAG: hypothetical protein R3B69_02665 [Candidatus Paceibacterota bacterium]
MADKKTAPLKPLGGLFEKYKQTLVAPEATVINGFVEVVNDVLGITLDKKRLQYNPNTKIISILGQAVIRSELKANQTEIFTHMKGRFGAKNTPKTII